MDGSHCVPIEGPNAWTFNGDTARPTLQPSLKLTYNYGSEKTPFVCHSIVTDGRIAYCGDSTHALSGQTVELPEVEPGLFD